MADGVATFAPASCNREGLMVAHIGGPSLKRVSWVALVVVGVMLAACASTSTEPVPTQPTMDLSSGELSGLTFAVHKEPG